MDIASILNTYCRKIGIWLLSIVPLILASSLILFIFSASSDILSLSVDLKSDWDEVLFWQTVIWYIVLILSAFPFALNGFFMEKAFNKEIKRFMNSGLLIQGVEGFDEVQTKIKLLYRASYSIIGSVLISFFIFVSASAIYKSPDLSLAPLALLLVTIASIGLLAISSGASMLLRLPTKSAFQPGGLMKYYSPRSLTLKVDNLLTDSIIPQLDPITRIQMDEWSDSILKAMNSTYLPSIDDQTRLEQAREKIFLLVYLRLFLPEMLTEELFDAELKEIIDPNNLKDFLSGKHSRISLKTIKTVIKDVVDEIPGIFDIVQRIFVLVKEDLHFLKSKEEYITISHPNIHIGNIDPFRIIIFILNLKEFKKQVQLQVQTSMTSLDPDDASQKILLDPSNIKLPENIDTLEISASTEQYDVLRIVSAILQVGDAINLQFRPNRFGTHVLNVSIEDEEGVIAGRSIVVSVQRDLMFYLKTVGAKALGYVGAAISFIGIGLGSFITLT